ncbi:hypothetical protein BLS_007105 [Venturia inaequalis]|uniref:Short-chain dehydrogenase/reductase 3 n=1 Tax=Venturia inaequalis TaxID=5025 RepID=A0A8H3UGM5_VENIN|nr:hypothetical protein BLS_007105 [Venturia inaequalis]KAE9970322.1 hypothetical protein EG327_010306 [Venturia inaequalis]
MSSLRRLAAAVSATLLYILTLGSESLRASAIRFLVDRRISIHRVKELLKTLLKIELFFEANNLLNIWARNNWQIRNKEKWDWPKEVAVVTGGAGGIGVLVVEGLAKKGVKVAALDLVDLPERVAALPNVKFCKCDITSKDDVERAASEIRTSFGSPSILCNNAGIAHAHTILEAAPEYLTKLFNVNVISQFYTIQAFLPDMIKANKGHVISTASVASFVTCCGLVDYAASKAAVMALNEGLQQELKHRYNAPEIKTSIVHPIYVKTPLVTSYAKSLEKSKAVQIDPKVVANAILKQIESGRSGKVVLPAIFAPLANARAWADWVQQLIGDSSKDDVKNEFAVAKAG